MSFIFNEILYRPLLNLAVFLYNILPGHDFGLAIIALTILIRIILHPFSVKAIKSQKALNLLGPKLNEMKEKYKDNPSVQSAEILKLYKENKVNPFAGCLPLIIQLPILFALYKTFINGINSQSLSLIYSFISRPQAVNNLFLGMIDITTKKPVFALIAGVLQFLQSYQQSASLKSQAAGASKEMAALNKQMLYFLPAFIIIIGWNLPAGLLLYWITTTAFSIFEQSYIKIKIK